MLTYNGVQFPFTFTEAHSSEPEWDPSNTDVLYTKTTVAVRGVFSYGQPPAVEGESPAATVARVRHLLTSPRRRLTYAVGGVTMLDVAEDDANGPTPDPAALRVEALAGGVLVHFSVSVRLRHCTAADGRGYLSLKWSDTEVIGRDWSKTRRRSGLLVLSRQFTPNADDRRGLVVPLVPPGFRRESAQYVLSEDGLRLRFSFEDRQLHRAVPEPAVRVSGSQYETVPLRGGLRRGELSVRLEGPPGAKARDLFNAALRLAMPRVYASGVRTDKAGYMIGGGLRESLDDSETAVELNLSWYIAPSPGRSTGRAPGPGWDQIILGPGGAIAADFLTGGALQNRTPENRDRAAVPIVAPWLGVEPPGTSLAAGVPSTTRGVGLAAAVRPLAEWLYDPCGAVAELQSAAGGSELVGTGAGASVTAAVGNPQPDDQEGVADDPNPGVWEEWKMWYSFAGETGYGVLPSTKPGAAGTMIRHGNPTKRLLVRWQCKRTGATCFPPELKVPRPGGYTGDGTHDENWVGIRYVRTYEDVDLAGDGVSFVYLNTGEAEFHAKDANIAGEAYPCPPWLAPAKKPTPTAVSPPPPPAPAGQIPTNPFLDPNAGAGIPSNPNPFNP